MLPNAAHQAVTLKPASGLADFQVGRVIGAGSFGRVSVARHLATGTVCVIKALSKAACIQQGHVSHRVETTNAQHLFMNSKQPISCHACCQLCLWRMHKHIVHIGTLHLNDMLPSHDAFAGAPRA